MNFYFKNRKIYLIILLLVLGIIIYLYPSISVNFLPLSKTYTDTEKRFTFHYPANGNIYMSSSKTDNTPNVVRVFLGPIGKSKACDLFLNSGYREPSSSTTENYGGITWNKWKMDTFTPPLGNLYDTHSVIWWTNIDGHNYRWQASSDDDIICGRIVKTFIVL